MKIALIAAAATTLASAPPQQSLQFTPDGQPIDRTAEKVCANRIETVRAERGLPRLEREAASPQEPLFFTALDHRIDGCGVLVMRVDTSDIRPVPPIPDDQPLFMPAR